MQVRAFHTDGSRAGTAKIANIDGGDTRYFFTHETEAFNDASTNLNASNFIGRARISSEVPNVIVCGADFVDAANFPPTVIVPRRMIRHPRGTSGGED